MMSAIQRVLIGVCCWTATAGLGICDNQFEIDCVGQITTTFGNHLSIKVDLGELPQASSGLINMRLENQTQEPVTLGRYRTGCKCLEIEAPTDPINPGASASVRIKLKTPNTPKQVDQFANYTLSSDPKQLSGNTELHLVYRISGLVAFRDSIASITAMERDRQIRFSLPLVVNPGSRIQASDLKISLPEQYSKMKTDFVEESGQWKLDAIIDVKDLESDLVSGEIRIQSKATNFSDTITCIVKIAERIQVSPKPLRITKNDKGVYEGTAFVKLAKQPGNNSTVPYTEQVSVKANLKGATVKSTAKSFNGGVARLKFEIIPKDDEELFNPEGDPDGIFVYLNYKGVDYDTKVAIKRVAN